MATITPSVGSDGITTANFMTKNNANLANLNSDKMETSVLDTDTTLAANSDLKVATQKAVKAYVDTGGNVNASETTKGIVEEASDAEVTAGTATGATGAKLFVTPAKLATNLGTTVADTTALKSGLQQTVGAISNATVKLYYNVHALFSLYMGETLDNTITRFTNWERTDATKVAIPPLGNMASFASTADAELYLNNSFYSSGSTVLSFADNNIVIMDWWAKYISGAGENMMGIGLVGEFSTINTDNNTLAIFNIRNGVLFSHTSKTATKSSNNISSGLTLTNWNNYRIEFDMGADTVTFYVNGVLKATHTGASIPTSGTVAFGFGRDTTNPVLFNVTAPNLSLEMNP